MKFHLRERKVILIFSQRAFPLESLQGTIEGAPGPRPEATEAMESLQGTIKGTPGPRPEATEAMASV